MELLFGHEVHLQHAYLVGRIALACIHETHRLALVDCAVHNLEICDNASKGVEDAVKNHGLQGSLRVALWSGYLLDDGAENVVNAFASAPRGADYILALYTEELNDFVLNLLGHGVYHVALREHGDYLQVVLDGHVEV